MAAASLDLRRLFSLRLRDSHVRPSRCSLLAETQKTSFHCKPLQRAAFKSGNSRRYLGPVAASASPSPSPSTTPKMPNPNSAEASSTLPHLILPPISGEDASGKDRESGEDETRVDVLLVLLPGALTPTEAYRQLAEEVQRAAGHMRLWVTVFSFTENFASPEKIKEAHTAVREELREMGFKDGPMPSSNVFFAGHSLGAFEGRAPALILAQAFIQIGSYFDPEKDNLAQYPKPVLSIAGEYDGQLPLPIYAKAAGEVASTEAQVGKAYLISNKPTVVIPGMNHCQVSHGIRNIERGDWEATISIEQAKAEVAKVISTFLKVQLWEGERREAAFEELRERVRESEEFLQPFWEATRRQREGWENMQETLLETAGLTSSVEQFKTEILWHNFPDNFVYSKPWIDRAERKIFCQARLVPQGKYKLSGSVWLKLKSAEAVHADLSLSSEIDESGSDVNTPPQEKTGNYLEPKTKFLRVAASVNERMFQKALSNCSETVRIRYEKTGKKVKFLDDRVADSAVDWVESDVAVLPSEDGSEVLCVQSPVVMTSARGMNPRFAGMHYVKVWTEARAMEWVMVDAFR